MTKRPTALAVLAVTALGALLGLADLRGLLTYLGSQWAEWTDKYQDLPRPTSILWLEGAAGVARKMEGTEGWLAALTLVALFFALLALAALLQPGFRLSKPPEENEGQGITTHLEVPLLMRVAAVALLSFWLCGALAPVSMFLAGSGGQFFAAARLLAGLPTWTALLPGFIAPVVHSLLLFSGLWLLWGPSGPLSRAPGSQFRETLLTGLLAGLAAIPAVIALHDGRMWLGLVTQAYSMADRDGWKLLQVLTVILPVAGAFFLLLVGLVFRPGASRLLTPRRIAFAVAAPLFAFFGSQACARIMERMDVQSGSLARTLQLPASGLQRFALLLAPEGQTFFSIVPDGSGDRRWDRIACNGETVKAAEQFLEKRNYRSRLTYRAYVHLHDCASLDWLTTESLKRNLETLERAPYRVAAQLLEYKLMTCPILPENREVLDRLADPAVFAWRDPQVSKRTLGRLYLRFGDMDRARSYLMDAGLDQAGFRQLMGGLSPLTEGKVRGRLTFGGKAVAGVRLGLVHADQPWGEMVTEPRPHTWRHVSAAAHTDEKGNFEFTHLAEGRYFLVITGGGIGRVPGQPIVTGHPRMFQLDRFRPTQILPKIDINFRPVDPSQPGRTGRNTA